MPPQLEENAGNLSYELNGSGKEALIVIPGIGLSAAYLKRFSDVLAKDWRVLTFDHRGVGRSTLPCPWRLSVEQAAGDIVRLADHAGVNTFTVVGESYGGMVGLALARDYPSRVRKLITVNTSVGGFHVPRLSAYATGQMIKSGLNPAKRAEMIMSFNFSKDTFEQRPETLEEWRQVYKEHGIPIGTTEKQIIAAMRFRPGKEVECVRCPCLVVFGEHDAMVPNENSRILSTYLPDAELVMIPSGGHHLTFEHPELLSKHIAGFLQEPKPSLHN